MAGARPWGEVGTGVVASAGPAGPAGQPPPPPSAPPPPGRAPPSSRAAAAAGTASGVVATGVAPRLSSKVAGGGVLGEEPPPAADDALPGAVTAEVLGVAAAAADVTAPADAALTGAPPGRRWWGSPSSADALRRATPLLLLNAVTVLWGSQHAVIKLAVDGAPPSAVTLARFGIAAAAAAPFLPSPTTPGGRRTWAAGAELAAYMFAGYAFQAVGLLTTTASRSGFLLYLNVKFVPLLAAVLYRRRLSAGAWASAALAFAGTAVLAGDGATPLVVGDAWCVAAAAASAVFILRLEAAAAATTAADAPPNAAAALNAVSLVGVAAAAAVWAFGVDGLSGAAVVAPFFATAADADGGGGGGGGGGWWGLSASAVGGVVYLGLVTTALCNWLQTLAQRSVAAERAAVVYAMDPVYGALFAAALLGERLSPQGLVGAAMITVAAVVNQRATPKYDRCAVDDAPTGGAEDRAVEGGGENAPERRP
ncbi:hypothetical protein I4F81_011134 [Pyropia yezoensis]|uniref:Uncharacterized protein n=1 Tax=Pyropia yezoensis TaxID=2788 RepID=A0ACC3CEJ9_PYRYE|nr:hypothetical protein I4F81_011134 [Neopyropia yezoensis]